MVDVSTPTRRRKAASAASATSNEESVGGSTPRKRIVKENTNSSSATISNLMPSICLFVMGILGIAVSLLVFLYYPILLEHSKQLQSMVFTKIFESKKPTVSRNAPADEPAAQRPIAHSLNIAGYCLRKDTSKSKHMCGEDAFLISESTGNKEGSGRSFFAVADGVGGWSESGGDSSKVSVGILDAIKAQLDETMEEEAEEFSRLIVQVGSKAFDQLKQAQLKRGSTTVCAALFDHVSGVLEVANVGDSGAFVIRNGRVISRTRAGLDGFNTPHQLGFDDAGNAYGSFERMHTLVKETLRKGDVVVVVSDGVIDNLFEFEIEQAVQLLVGSLINEEDGSGAGKRISHLVTDRHLAMQERLTSASMTLALMAYARGKESLWVSPFAETAMAHGYSYAGGKQDDISVIIAVAK